MSNVEQYYSSFRHSAFGIRHSALQPVTLQPTIEGRTAQSERFRGLADVAVEARHGLLDQEALDILEAHVLEASAASVFARAQSEVGRSDERPLRHEDGAFHRMIQFAHVPRPAVLEQRLHRAAL